MAINQKLLGKSIRQVRELRGLSQAALAELAGVRGNSVALIERGERGVSLDLLNELANALNVPAACLTMLGTSEIAGDANSKSFVASLQKLILATIVAQATIEAKEEAEKAKQHRIEETTRSFANIIEQHVKHLAARGTPATPTKVKAAKGKAAKKTARRLAPA
jgi:transcriptional regulator with XRE-family HTH domain